MIIIRINYSKYNLIFQHITFIKYVHRCLAAAHWSRVYLLHSKNVLEFVKKLATLEEIRKIHVKIYLVLSN